MDPHLKAFRELMLALWHHHEKPWKYSNAQAQKIYEAIGSGLVSFGNESEVEELLPSEASVDREFDNRYLYLNPVTHGMVMVPLLTLKADFGRSVPEIRLRVGLFLLHDDQIRSLGFRFEAPEGKSAIGAGRHNYYHVQMIRGLGSSISFSANEYLQWFPDAEPTFPVDANDPVKLLLSLLISLYGLDEVGILIAHVGAGTELQTYLREMQCLHTNELEWYWKVSIGKTAKVEYWKTSKTPTEFRDHISSKYPGSAIIGVAKGTFRQIPKPKSY